MRPKILSTAGIALACWGALAPVYSAADEALKTGRSSQHASRPTAVAGVLGGALSAQLEALTAMQLRVPRRPTTQPAEGAATPDAAANPGAATSGAAAPSAAAAAAPESPRVPVDVEEHRPFGYAGIGGFSHSHGGGSEDFLPISDRWRIGIPGDYVQQTRGMFWDPYNQNVLKGDYPIYHDDIFLVLTGTSDSLIEARRTPIPSNVSTLRGDSLGFFGEGDTQLYVQNFIFTFELFEGDTAYKPRDWELRITPVMQINYVRAEELQITDPDFQEGRHRNDTWIGFQELFYERHMGDLSNNYDFWAIRGGIQGFTSDFRGFLFSDNEPGIRAFGTLDNAQTQWNLAAFSMLEKDTNSGLNTFSSREQYVFIANLFRQDFLKKGYTAQLSYHFNMDQPDTELDENGFIVRPQPVGSIREKEVRAHYIGWAGDGHIGRLNISHQFYQALGEETFNPIAGQEVDINAQFFAVELSYDQDYIRYRASFAYSSGDDDIDDDTATGFDTIFDNPNFAGGGFSYVSRQAIALTGSRVGLFQRNSFVPNLRTSKEQGQASFVNPGLFLFNVGMDIETTPRTKVILNANYLMFDDTEVLEQILMDDKIRSEIGLDLSVGFQYRPFLNNNVIFTAGGAVLIPGKGFRDLYSSETLYSTFLSMTLTF